jgi:hypothetical protein
MVDAALKLGLRHSAVIAVGLDQVGAARAMATTRLGSCRAPAAACDQARARHAATRMACMWQGYGSRQWHRSTRTLSHPPLGSGHPTKTEIVTTQARGRGEQSSAGALRPI